MSKAPFMGDLKSCAAYSGQVCHVLQFRHNCFSDSFGKIVYFKELTEVVDGDLPSIMKISVPTFSPK